eukprot:EG_transcript_3008
MHDSSRIGLPEEALRALGMFSTVLNPMTNAEKQGAAIAGAAAEAILKGREDDATDRQNPLARKHVSVPLVPTLTKVSPHQVPAGPPPAPKDLQHFLQGNRINFNVISQGSAAPRHSPPVAPQAILGSSYPASPAPPIAGPSGSVVVQPPWMSAMAAAAPSAVAAMQNAVPMVVPASAMPAMARTMPLGMTGMLPFSPGGAPSLFPMTANTPASFVPTPKPSLPKSKYEPLLKRPQSSLEDEEDLSGVVECMPIWPGDCRGIIYQIATDFGRLPWSCPVLSGKVGVRSTLLTRGWPSDIVAPVFEFQVCYTENEPNAFASVDLRTYRACVTHYALAHRHSGPGRPAREPYTGYFIRNWEMQGSDDGQTWDLLSEHKNDSMINKFRPYSIANVKVEPKKFYRHFRVRVVDPGNSQGTHALIISCLELYGRVEPIPFHERHLYSDPPPPPPPPKPPAFHRQGKGQAADPRRRGPRRKGGPAEEGPSSEAEAEAPTPSPGDAPSVTEAAPELSAAPPETPAAPSPEPPAGEAAAAAGGPEGEALIPPPAAPAAGPGPGAAATEAPPPAEGPGVEAAPPAAGAAV